MGNKQLSGIIAAAALAGAGIGHAIPPGMKFKVHQVDFVVDTFDGKRRVHRNVSALVDKHSELGVVALRCDDEKIQARLMAEVVAAESECQLP